MKTSRKKINWSSLMSKRRGRPRKESLSSASDIVEDFISDRERELSGSERHFRATKDWSKTAQEEHEDTTIEGLLADDEFLGTFNIWPSVKESLAEIWHRRCDFEISFQRSNPTGGPPVMLGVKEVYALNHPHAKRKAKRQWPTMATDADTISSRKKNHIHTLVYEMPRGAGKDFEMSLLVILLIRDLLVQRMDEFYPFYDLSPDTRISVNLMNRTEFLAKRVTFAEVLPKFNIPFFMDYFPPANIDLQKVIDEKDQPSELRFPRNIVVFPGTGATSSTLGYALAALVLDECNNMSKNLSASQTIGGSEETTGDAATDIYLDGRRRIESRMGQFVFRELEVWGIIICLSQSRTAMDFTKKLEQLSIMDPGILYKNFPFWDRKPLNLSGESFTFDTRTLSILDIEEAKEKYERIGVISAEVFNNA